MNNEIEVFYPKNQAAWRLWLEQNHISKQSVWLVYYSKSSGKETITWSQAVDEALCFGWIDSKRVKIDSETSHQFFCKRKPKSTWSKINKEKIERLSEQGLMAEAGFAVVEIAKQNGSWTLLDEAEDLIVPSDLEALFVQKPNCREFYLSLSKSNKKMILHRLVLAKTKETREKRIAEITVMLENKQKL